MDKNVSNRPTLREFGLHMLQDMSLPRRRHHPQVCFEWNPSKFAVFVVDHSRCLGIHKADEDRQHPDGIAIDLIELLAYVWGIKTITDQAGFFADLT